MLVIIVVHGIGVAHVLQKFYCTNLKYDMGEHEDSSLVHLKL